MQTLEDKYFWEMIMEDLKENEKNRSQSIFKNSHKELKYTMDTVIDRFYENILNQAKDFNIIKLELCRCMELPEGTSLNINININKQGIDENQKMLSDFT